MNEHRGRHHGQREHVGGMMQQQHNMGHDGRGHNDLMMMHNPHQQPHQQQQYGHPGDRQGMIGGQNPQQQYGQYPQQQQQQQQQQQMMGGNNGMPGMMPSQSWGAMPNLSSVNNVGGPTQQQQLPVGGVAMPLNGALPPLSLVNPQHNQPAQVQMSPPQQPQQSPRGQPEFAVLSGQQSPPSSASKQSQLLAGTQSMLNGISAITSVVPAITPIGKVKRFQFGSPNGATPQSMLAQSQISPAYLPPLATTPRFAVPTPRGSQQYHAINLQTMNAPMQIRQVSSQQSTKEEETTTTTAADLQGQAQMKSEDAVKRIVVASSPRAGDHIKVISPRMGLAV